MVSPSKFPSIVLQPVGATCGTVSFYMGEKDTVLVTLLAADLSLPQWLAIARFVANSLSVSVFKQSVGVNLAAL